MSMNDTTVICPGQGAQALGMGCAWMEASEAARAIFDRANDVLGDALGAPLSELCRSGPVETLNRTDVSQPAIYVCSIASWHGLTDGEAPVPTCTAGLSLGEYTALHLAGVLSFEDGLQLVARRGELMQAAAQESDGTMLAVMGLADESEATTFCDEVLAELGGGVLVPANLNAPGQIVLSGDTAACSAAADACAQRGLRATPLSVAGAFHSAHMASAARGLEQSLQAAEVRSPACEVWSNVTADRYDADPEGIRRLLVEQLTSPVRWASQCGAMVEAGRVVYTELAPGKVLRGLMRRISRDAKVTSHDEPDPTHAT
ncbi:MAG: ACP S-malonyltransferase [Phycisphaerales bacterium]|nr:ACP S-malonyltransferase [Phycisphaerales bacterium]